MHWKCKISSFFNMYFSTVSTVIFLCLPLKANFWPTVGLHVIMYLCIAVKLWNINKVLILLMLSSHLIEIDDCTLGWAEKDFFSNLTWVEIKRRVYMRKWAWENFSSLRQKISDLHALWKGNFLLKNVTNVHNIPIFCITRYWTGEVSISNTHAFNSICESFTLIC